MNPKTLDDLIRKGLDERTPDLEALACLRIAVKQFGEGRPSAQDTERMGKLEEERDQARAEASKHRAEADRLKLLLGKMLALKEAEQKLEKSKADVEREAREALGQKAAPARPIDPSVSAYVQDWFNQATQHNGGFKW